MGRCHKIDSLHRLSWRLVAPYRAKVDIDLLWRRMLNSGPPFVASIFPIPTLAAADLLEVLDELDAHDILRVLVAKLSFHAKTHRGAVRHRQRSVVEIVGEDRLRVKRILKVDAFVVRLRVVLRVGAVKDDKSRRRLRLHGFEERRESRAPPFADRTPTLDAIVTRDLRPAGERTQLGQ